MEGFKREILGYVSRRDYSPEKIAALGRSLGVSDDDFEEFKSAVKELRGAGRVVIGSTKLITLPHMSGKVIGTFRANPKGFGFGTGLFPASFPNVGVSDP